MCNIFDFIFFLKNLLYTNVANIYVLTLFETDTISDKMYLRLKGMILFPKVRCQHIYRIFGINKRCCILLGIIVRDFKTVAIFKEPPYILASTSKIF